MPRRDVPAQKRFQDCRLCGSSHDCSSARARLRGATFGTLSDRAAVSGRGYYDSAVSALSAAAKNLVDRLNPFEIVDFLHVTSFSSFVLYLALAVTIPFHVATSFPPRSFASIPVLAVPVMFPRSSCRSNFRESVERRRLGYLRHCTGISLQNHSRFTIAMQPPFLCLLAFSTSPV